MYVSYERRIIFIVRCGLVFKPGEMFYQCRTCATKNDMCLCRECFSNGNHDGHDYTTGSVPSGNYGDFCDCGDDRWIKPGQVYCSLHRHEGNSLFNYLNQP